MHTVTTAVHEQWRYACNSYSLLIENKGSGMGLLQDLRREHIAVIAINPEGDKTMRMVNQTAKIEAGCVYLPIRAPWLGDFRREICEFPGGRYDDQVDALSQALSRAFEPRRQIVVQPILGHY